ncbi:MAG: TRASH domain protein [Desulfobulbaceae bacterium]|jgi:YHS domain-containing protein|nr:MAG: TRASH domain protein [Desulfobulbaceae bacterium]
MTPLRLIIISCLLYILYRLLSGLRKKGVYGKNQGAAASGKAVQDVLVEDPVCHTFVPKGQAVQLHHDKQMYYFCSNKCCEMFLKTKGAEE